MSQLLGLLRIQHSDCR